MTTRDPSLDSRAHLSALNADSASPVRSGRDLAVIALVALAARLAYFFINRRTNPAFDYLIMDSMHIDHWAKAIVAGDAGPAVYFRGPLYPYVLALIYKMTHSSVAAAVVVNHLLGTAMCASLYLLAREYVSRTIAFVAGVVAALYWPFIYFEGEILIEPLFMLLVVLTLWRLARAVRRPTIVRLAVAGACLGLAALARPTILALIAALPFVFRPRSPADGTTGIRGWLRSSAVVAVACAIVIFPALFHNATVGKAWVPVAWSGGLNFYIGNNPSSDGRSAFLPGANSAWMGGAEEALAAARQQAGRELSPAEASDFYFHRGLDFVTTQPGAALKLTAEKLFMFWEGPERSNEKYIYFFWDRFGLGRIPMPGFWLISPLALAGMIRLWPRRRDLALLYGFVITYMIGIVAFFVVARYRLPVVPVLIVFASWSAVDLYAALRDRRWKTVGVGGVLFAALFLITNASYPHFMRQRTGNIAISHYTLAGALAEQGKTDPALVELVRAREAFERAPSTHYEKIAQDIYWKLGSAFYLRGRCKEATDALGHILPSNPNADAARQMFADCCEKTGRPAEAGKAYLMILRKDPANRPALEGLLRCYEATGNYDEAAKVRKQLGSE
jgi:4-amino-4-deoxy-L-arabinose transferase-like glycosyltransferase